MARKGSTAEQIIGSLREVEAPVHQGHTLPEAAWRIGVSDRTYYVWRKEYGSIGVEQARRLKEPEKELDAPGYPVGALSGYPMGALHGNLSHNARE